MFKKPLLQLLVLLSLLPALSFKIDPPIYKKGWIDLNKNGKKDVYEDSKQPISLRVNDLLAQMNLEEKTCQMATLYGWKRVLKDSLPTEGWKKEIWKDGIANIDEHLNGFLNWGKTSNLDLVTDVMGVMSSYNDYDGIL